VIRKWDPYGLLKMGCPEDEFDREIHSLVRQIPRMRSADDAIYAISRVFSSAFGPGKFQPEVCADVGHELFEALCISGLLDVTSAVKSGRERPS
jgi:hypothetical protein